MVYYLPVKRRWMDTINRKRKFNRPNDVTDLSFILNHDHIPDDFLIDDISVESSGNRHLIFMTITMIRLLSTALSWLVIYIIYIYT